MLSPVRDRPPSPRSSGRRETSGSPQWPPRWARGSPRHHPASQVPGRGLCRRPGPVHLDNADQSPPRPRPPGRGPAARGSVARAYQFLDQMMDLPRAAAPAPRLVQSYTGGLLGQRGDTSASSYDNALLIDAYLAQGTPAGWPGRRPSAARWSTCRPTIALTTGGCATGTSRPHCTTRATSRPRTRPAAPATLAWAGQALAQLYAATRIRAYLRARSRWATGSSPSAGTGAGRAGTRAATPRPGRRSNGSQPSTTSTCSRSSGCWPGRPATRSWSQRAAWARRFVVSMWDPAQGRFYLGTAANGVTPERQRAGRGRE